MGQSIYPMLLESSCLFFKTYVALFGNLLLITFPPCSHTTIPPFLLSHILFILSNCVYHTVFDYMSLSPPRLLAPGCKKILSFWQFWYLKYSKYILSGLQTYVAIMSKLVSHTYLENLILFSFCIQEPQFKRNLDKLECVQGRVIRMTKAHS